MSTEFEEIWALKPRQKSKVYVYNKETDDHEEKQIYRSYLSYLSIPPHDETVKKSIMYDGLEPSVPNCLMPYIRDAWLADSRYNSLTVNFYEPEDYIEPHRDCDNHMVDDYVIRVVSLGEIRPIVFEPVDECLCDPIQIKPEEVFAISKQNNQNYRHSVGSGQERRISLTFRMLK